MNLTEHDGFRPAKVGHGPPGRGQCFKRGRSGPPRPPAVTAVGGCFITAISSSKPAFPRVMAGQLGRNWPWRGPQLFARGPVVSGRSQPVSAGFLVARPRCVDAASRPSRPGFLPLGRGTVGRAGLQGPAGWAGGEGTALPTCSDRAPG